MTSHVTSADGTKIAFDRLGEGPAVIVISGLLCNRQTTQQLAEQLAQQFCVINYDRRGGLRAPTLHRTRSSERSKTSPR